MSIWSGPSGRMPARPTMRPWRGRGSMPILAVARARVYADTRGGALKEAGDLVIPLANGIFREADLQGDLFQLCRGEVEGRKTTHEITLFKSVGTAIEDLAAAMLVFRKLG